MPGPGAYLFGDEEKKELLDLIESGHLVRYGNEDDLNFKQKVIKFEQKFAEFTNAKHCLAVNSGTSALLCCLAALGIGPGDEVIVPGYTFVASVSSIIYSRAIPVLTEIDESLTIDPTDIVKKITKKTKAIIVVHMLGNPCDMDKIMKIAKENNLYVIEDCCQAVGGSYKGRKLGTIGNMGAYSMNYFKTISTGEGGMVVTNNTMLYERAFAFHDQGHRPNRKGVEIGNRTIVGLNLKMNELTGAIALAQVNKINTIVSILREKKKILKSGLENVPKIKFRKINDEYECATILTIIFDNKNIADKFAEKIGTKTLIHSGWHVYNNMEHILNKTSASSYNCPYICKAYDKEMEYKKHMLPMTDDILERSVNISVGVVDAGIGASFGINIQSTIEEIKDVVSNIKNIIDEF